MAMKAFVNYAIVACLAVITWEYGHPYIPGLVVDHPVHEHLH